MASTSRLRRSTIGRAGTPPTSSRAKTAAAPTTPPERPRFTSRVPSDDRGPIFALRKDVDDARHIGLSRGGGAARLLLRRVRDLGGAGARVPGLRGARMPG